MSKQLKKLYGITAVKCLEQSLIQSKRSVNGGFYDEDEADNDNNDNNPTAVTLGREYSFLLVSLEHPNSFLFLH